MILYGFVPVILVAGADIAKPPPRAGAGLSIVSPVPKTPAHPLPETNNAPSVFNTKALSSCQEPSNEV